MTQTQALTLPSPAKINLFLHINGRRADGYHELQTLFQFLDYGDTITLTPLAQNNIELSTPLTGVDDKDNLVVKAATLLKEACGYPWGARIAVDKKIPMGAGLGGGSSNAATVLLGLNALWELGLSIDQLALLGLQLGADVPVFVRGQAAFAEGVGERLTPAEPTQKWYLVVNPGCSVNTSSIFQAIDLKRDTKKIELNHTDWILLQNDCEKVAFQRYPDIEKAMKWLLEYAPSRMTGTGSCVFGMFDTAEQARQALSQLPLDMSGFIAQGVNTSPVHQQLGL